MSKYLLNKRINDVESVFDIDALLSRKASSIDQIAKYYRLNRLAYKLVNSKEGFVHMGISLAMRYLKKKTFWSMLTLFHTI